MDRQRQIGVEVSEANKLGRRGLGATPLNLDSCKFLREEVFESGGKSPVTLQAREEDLDSFPGEGVACLDPVEKPLENGQKGGEAVGGIDGDAGAGSGGGQRLIQDVA
jgi:hypothetical protein